MAAGFCPKNLAFAQKMVFPQSGGCSPPGSYAYVHIYLLIILSPVSKFWFIFWHKCTMLTFCLTTTNHKASEYVNDVQVCRRWRWSITSARVQQLSYISSSIRSWRLVSAQTRSARCTAAAVSPRPTARHLTYTASTVTRYWTVTPLRSVVCLQ